MENKCVICGKTILFRKTEKAKTCCQSCAGKLAWQTIRGLKKKSFWDKWE